MKPEAQTINSRIQAAALSGAALQDGQALAVPIDRIVGNAYQPRNQMDEEELLRLMASIEQGSLLQNVLVRPLTEPGRSWDSASGQFALVAGHRRWTAFKRLHEKAVGQGDAEGVKRFAAIPAIVRFGLTEDEQAINALEENVHRAALNCWEEAKAVGVIRELMTKKAQKDVTDAEVAERLGYDTKRVSRLRFLADRAPEFLQKAMTGELRIAKDRDAARPRLDFHAAYAFTELFDHAVTKAGTPKQAAKVHERVEHLVRKALEEGWPLRRIQEHVKAVKAGRAKVEDAGEEGAAAASEAAPLFTEDERRQKLSVSLAFTGASSSALAALADKLETIAASAREAAKKAAVSAV